MNFKLSATDKWFFYSIPPYVAIGIADIVYKWCDPTFISAKTWVLWLLIGVIYFRLWK